MARQRTRHTTAAQVEHCLSCPGRADVERVGGMPASCLQHVRSKTASTNTGQAPKGFAGNRAGTVGAFSQGIHPALLAVNTVQAGG